MLAASGAALTNLNQEFNGLQDLTELPQSEDELVMAVDDPEPTFVT